MAYQNIETKIARRNTYHGYSRRVDYVDGGALVFRRAIMDWLAGLF